MTNRNRMQKLQETLSIFANERNWQQYHSPKNLATALSVECSELLEIFQWMTADQSYTPDPATRTHIHEEIGDIMIYLSMIAAKFDIDPIEAASAKLKKNRTRYPIHLTD